MVFLKLAKGAGGCLAVLAEGGVRLWYFLVLHYYLHSPTALSTLALGECERVSVGPQPTTESRETERQRE